MYGNAEHNRRGSKKGKYRTEEEKACSAGYQPAAACLCLGQMGVGNGAPEMVASELKTDTCTAGYQPATDSLCLGRMDKGKGAPEKVTPELKTDTCKKQPRMVKGHTE